MKHAIILQSALALAMALALTGCAADGAASSGSGAGSSSQSALAEADVALYDCGGLTAAIPAEYIDLLVVEPGEGVEYGWGAELLEVCERASQEALKADFGDGEGGGFLFGIAKLDQAAYEQHLMNDYGGIHPFAKDSDGSYYAKTVATDVRFYRSEDELSMDSPDWQQWETLSALGDEVCADFISRNGLTAYNDREFYDRDFTYDGEHAYVQYYNYYDFDGDRRMWDTLVLSQPARQGEGGIWCVERYYDLYGGVYYNFPGDGTPAAERYAALQAQCDAGERPDLLTPLGAAIDFAQASVWHDSEDVSAESFELVDAPDAVYFQINSAAHSYVIRGPAEFSLAALTRTNSDGRMPFLDCINSFTPDTWGVLGRCCYGSDWWPALKDSLEKAAVGDGQESRGSAFLHLYLSAPGEPYKTDIAALLRTQRDADPAAFDAALAGLDSDAGRQAVQAAL